jgi:hypothetical protein
MEIVERPSDGSKLRQQSRYYLGVGDDGSTESARPRALSFNEVN